MSPEDLKIFHEAASQGNLSQIPQDWITRKNLTTSGPEGICALDLIAVNNTITPEIPNDILEDLDFLLSQNSSNKHGDNFFHKLCKKGLAKKIGNRKPNPVPDIIVAHLQSPKVYLTPSKTKETIFHSLAYNGRFDLLSPQTLKAAQNQIDDTTKDDYTVLHYAIFGKNFGKFPPQFVTQERLKKISGEHETCALHWLATTGQIRFLPKEFLNKKNLLTNSSADKPSPLSALLEKDGHHEGIPTLILAAYRPTNPKEEEIFETQLRVYPELARNIKTYQRAQRRTEIEKLPPI